MGPMQLQGMSSILERVFCSKIDKVLFKCEQDRIFRFQRQMCVIWSGTLCLALHHDLFKSGLVHAGVNDVLKLRTIIYVS